MTTFLSTSTLTSHGFPFARRRRGPHARSAERGAIVLAVGVLVAASTGCTTAVYSPPARAIPLETAATLARGDIGVQAEGGPSMVDIGLTAISGTVRVRRGMTENLDASLEGSLVHLEGDPATPISPNILSSRLGAKYRLHPCFAATFGVGGGGSAGGAFVSPDLGAIVAWENPYVVPFLSARASVSQPIGAKSVDVTERGEPPRSHVDIPRTTWIANGTLGLRVPIAKWSILGGVGLTHLAHTRDSDTAISASGGVEAVF